MEKRGAEKSTPPGRFTFVRYRIEDRLAIPPDSTTVSMEYSTKTSQITTALSEAPEKPLHQNGFGSKMRAIALVALSTMPAFLGVSSCGQNPRSEDYGGATSIELGNDANVGKRESRVDTLFGEKSENISSVHKEVEVTEEVVITDGYRVEPNQSGYYGHGYIVGSPINSGYTGPIYKTYELHLNQGYFPDDLSYIGSDVALSIDERDHDIFERFQAAEEESHQQYVFEYVRKHPLNPEIEDSSLFLHKVYSPSEFLEHLDVDSLPREIRAKEPWVGPSGTKTKVGRIVDIERFGQLGDFCILEINMSGLSNGQTGGEKLVRLTVMDEDIAAWCEKAMALGRDVEIEVSQDFWEVWQPSSMFVNAIKFKESAPKGLGVSEAQYEMVRDRLSKDPAFIESLKAQLAEAGKEK